MYMAFAGKLRSYEGAEKFNDEFSPPHETKTKTTNPERA